MTGRGSNQYRRQPAADPAVPGPRLLRQAGLSGLPAPRRWPRLLPVAPEMWREIADWGRIPPRVLRLLSRHPKSTVRAAVAVHWRTPPTVLQQLVGDPDQQVRWCVASNVHTPRAALDMLAGSQEVSVRIDLAGNPAAPVGTLQRLLRDPSRAVARAAVNNPSLSPAVRAVWQLAHGDDL